MSRSLVTLHRITAGFAERGGYFFVTIKINRISSKARFVASILSPRFRKGFDLSAGQPPTVMVTFVQYNISALGRTICGVLFICNSAGFYRIEIDKPTKER